MPGKILVTGGAGFIGSHICKELARRGHTPVVFDNFSTGHKEFCQFGESMSGDICHPDDISSALATQEFDAVVHCAALAVVNEDVPVEEYYMNNVAGTLNVLCSMREWGVKRIIYLSTGAGHESLYGSTKRIAEKIVTAFYLKHGIGYGIMRLQNVAGASDDGDIGEWHEPETHLIPNACMAVLGKKPGFTLYGSGYQQRDYVHVMDVAEEVADAVDSEIPTLFAHVGTGILRSSMSVVEQVEMIAGRKINAEYANKRKGDPLFNQTEKPKKPRRNINQIIESALEWHSK